MKHPLFSLLLACVLSAPVFGAVGPDDEALRDLAALKIADGFEVNLFASEADGAVKPIQIRFDAAGRLWMIGSSVYPQLEPGETPNDKVLIFEDTNRDGASDRTTVFADGLMIPTGLEIGDGGAYVGHGTELLHLRDTDGDNRADERRVVFRGFGTGDNHQNINSFLWGPGGALWMSQGLHTRSNVETPYGTVRLHEAGLWRLRPRLARLEGFYGASHEPQNPWGYVFTDWGEPIVLAGNNSSPIYPVPGLVSNHKTAAPPTIWKNGGGRKVSGGDIVGNSHFPDAWQGALILGGYINNAVWALKINEDGAGFALEDLPPLILSTNRSFRPVDAKFGPDGALYIADWHNPIIGHYQASFRHPDRDKTRGRIWRVTAKGRPLQPSPDLTSLTESELVGKLEAPDRWTRHFAKRALAERATDKVTPALEAALRSTSISELTLKEIVGVYQTHEVVAAEPLERLARATNADGRAYAAGVVGLWADRLTNALALLRPLAQDPHPRVRLQAVVSATYVPSAEAMEVAALAADFPADRFLQYALNQAVYALKPHWLPALRNGSLNLENQTSRIGMLVRADGTPDTLQAVRSLIATENLPANAREAYLKILAEHGDEDDLKTLLSLDSVELQARVLPTITEAARLKRNQPNDGLVTALKPLVNSTNERVSTEAMRLAGIWKALELQPFLSSVATNTTAPGARRRAAISSLSPFTDPKSHQALLSLAKDRTQGPVIQSAAIGALASADIKEAAEAATGALSQLTNADAIEEIFGAFFQRQGGATALANSLRDNPPSTAAAHTGLRLMNAAGREEPELARLLSLAAGLAATSKRMTPDELQEFIREVASDGNAERGAAIYQKSELGCVACHAIQNEGGTIGPNLSTLGSAQPVDFIIGAILEPQKEIKEGYDSVTITTKNGDELQGYLLRENAQETVIRDVLQNQEIRLRRDSIEVTEKNGSVMPAGLADTLTRPEFRDLIRFLSELGRTK